MAGPAGRIVQALAAIYGIRALFRRVNPETRAMRAARDEFYRTVWLDAAAEIAADVDHLGGGVMRLSRGDRSTLVCANMTSLDGPVALRIAGDKALCHTLLARAGVAMPVQTCLNRSDVAGALDALRHLSPPIVVKPSRSTGAGRGVTTGITTRQDLILAMARAGSFCREIILEEQVEGDVLRLLFLDGELLDAIVRQSPVVVGDGRSRIMDLIAAENDQRLRERGSRAQVLLDVDREMVRTLATQSLGLKSRPEAGRAVLLKRVINDNRGEENRPAGALLTPEVQAEARLAASVLGVRLAGVDMIVRTGDDGAITRSVVLEVNTTPGLFYHYRRQGGPARVAVPILERALGAGDTDVPPALAANDPVHV